jgi:hypothetical protein
MYITHIGLLHYIRAKRERGGTQDGGPKANIYVWCPYIESTSTDIMRHIGSIWLGDKVGWKNDLVSGLRDAVTLFSFWLESDGTNLFSIWS